MIEYTGFKINRTGVEVEVDDCFKLFKNVAASCLFILYVWWFILYIMQYIIKYQFPVTICFIIGILFCIHISDINALFLNCGIYPLPL